MRKRLDGGVQHDGPILCEKPSREVAMPTGFGKGGRLRRSGPARIIAGSLIDFGRRHLPRDVSHLLADIVAPRAGREGLELRLDIGGGLPVEPGRTELGVGRAMALIPK